MCLSQACEKDPIWVFRRPQGERDMRWKEPVSSPQLCTGDLSLTPGEEGTGLLQTLPRMMLFKGMLTFSLPRVS